MRVTNFNEEDHGGNYTCVVRNIDSDVTVSSNAITLQVTS